MAQLHIRLILISGVSLAVWKMFEADVVESLLPELVDFLGELEVDVIELRGAQNPGRAHLENLPAAEQCALCTIFCHLLCMGEDPVIERFATLQHDTRFLQPDQLAICGGLHVIVELIILDIQVSLCLKPAIRLYFVHIKGIPVNKTILLT